MDSKRQVSIVSWSLLFFVIGFGCAGISTFAFKQDFLMSTFVGMSGAFISFFLQFTYVEGHIFHKYYRWLETIRDNPKHPFYMIANPLGLCAYCQNMWVTMIAFIACVVFFDVSGWMFFPATGIAHVTLTILDKLFWSE